MRVTIDHREAISVFGRTQFFIDCTVQFSEAERAVIRNRQLGDHHIAVDGETPWFRSLTGYRVTVGALTFVFILSAVAIIPAMPIISLLGLNSAWWLLIVMVCIGS